MYPLVKLPDDMDRVLFLIREELKLIRFFRALADAGLSDPDIRPCLDLLILRELGLASCTDDCFRHYLDVMDRHSARGDASNDSFTERAMHAYEELSRIKPARD